MQFLTKESITDIVARTFIINLHESTITYIQNLLTPFVNGLETTTNINDYIQQNFRNYFYAIIFNLGTNPPKEEIIRIIIETMISQIIKGSTYDLSFEYMLFPWDLFRLTKNDYDLAKILHITGNVDTSTLPVTINPTNITEHTYNLTFEFVVGLSLFSNVLNTNFNIKIFDKSFQSDYIINDENRFLNYILSEYSVIVNDKQYRFNTTDFMRGFSTGALWLGLDHHKYWNDLVMYTYKKNGNQKIIPIDF